MPEPSAILKGMGVTRDQIFRAMGEFDLVAHETDWLSYKSQLYVLVHDGKPYPPKRTLSFATGLPVSSFSGGAEANGVLLALGFHVIAKEKFLSDPP